MRRLTLAARRAQRYLRRPPRPRWHRPAAWAAGGVALACVLAGTGWWLAASGLVGSAAAALRGQVVAWSQQAGLTVREVFVDGRARTEAEAVRAALGFALGAPLLEVDPAAIKARLERLPWVERASVARRLPDAVHIELLERTPMALWQHGGRFALVDRTGAVIEGAVTGPANALRFAHLPVLVGEHAPREAAELFAALSTEPELWSRVVAASWVGDRRWTLRLDNRVDVLLPEDDVLSAWRLLAASAREERLLERAVTVVDLRFLPDRMRLRLDPEAVEGSGA